MVKTVIPIHVKNKQGCLPSSLLFNSILKILTSSKIKKNKQNKTHSYQKETNLSLFASNMMVYRKAKRNYRKYLKTREKNLSW